MAKNETAEQAAHTWSSDVTRIEQIAVSAGVDGFACEPVEVIEMLCILDRHDHSSREELIQFAATALAPFTAEGSRMIDHLIKRARKRATT